MGKPCVGKKTNNSDLIKEARAFCEGLEWRAGGTFAERPPSANPHDVGSDAEEAWSQGWSVASNASGSTIDPADAPCCAVPQNTILA